jgi:N-acetylglucosaminyldiphosphoundecaprenol N-acetyl-beta-D-mannosaminyltransferase
MQYQPEIFITWDMFMLSKSGKVVPLKIKRDDVVELGGLPITTKGMTQSAQNFATQALAAREKVQLPYYSTSANGQVIALASKDNSFKKLLLEADEIHPDGMPMVHISQLLTNNPLSERVATTDLVHAVAEQAEKHGLSFYFLGGTPEVNEWAVNFMCKKYTKLIFSGSSHGYFSEDEEPQIVANIAKLKPDILWIGLGIPREQAFISKNLKKLNGVGVIKTSGGLFDFLSGKNKRAPIWMQKLGMEWIYRTFQEPRRLILRYLITNPIALKLLITESR